MNIKSVTTLFALFATASATAGTGNLESYYHGHQQEAFAKYDECKAEMENLASTGNAQAILALAENPQCKAAEVAVTLATAAE